MTTYDGLSGLTINTKSSQNKLFLSRCKWIIAIILCLFFILSLSAALCPNAIFAQNENSKKYTETTISMLASWDYAPLDDDLEKQRLEAIELTADGIYFRAVPAWTELALKLEENYGPLDQRTLGIKVRAAYVTIYSGDFNKALELVQNLTPFVLQEFGEDSLEYILIRETEAYAYRYLQDYEKAKDIFEDNKTRYLRLFGSGSRESLSADRKYAEILRIIGETEKAEHILRGTLDTLESDFGIDDPDTIKSAYSLSAFLFYSKDETFESMEIAQKIYDIAINIYGEIHPFVSSTLALEANILYEQGKIDDSINMYEQIANIESQTYGTSHPWYWNSIYEIAIMYRELYNYEKALELFISVLAAREQILGVDNPSTLLTKHYLALVYQSMGDYEQALTLFNEVLSAKERILGADHPSTLTTKDNLAGVYQSMGDYEQALTLFNEVLIARERVLGALNPDTLLTKHNLALVYKSMGDYEQALTLFNEVLSAEERILGVDNPSTLTSKNNLALVYQSMGDYEQALTLFNEVLSANERILGVDNPSTLTSKHNLALVYHSMGDYEKALVLFNEVLSAEERILGADNPSTLKTKNNMALVYHSMGDYEQALTLFNEVLSANERILGVDNPSTLTSKHNLTLVYESMGDYEKALTLFIELLSAEERILGVDNPSTLVTKNHLAFVYYCMDDYEKALTLFNEVLSAQERILGADNPSTLVTKNNLALVYYSIGDYEKALTLFNEVLSAEERILGADNPDTLSTKYNLARVYKSMGDYEQALTLFNDVLSAEERVLGPLNPSTALTTYNLGILYYDTNNIDLAIFYVKAAIKSTHLTRINIASLDESLQKSFLELVEQRYHFLCKLLIEAGRDAEAEEVILLLKMDELQVSTLSLQTVDSFYNYTRENLFKDTPEGPALDTFFNISRALASLGEERRALIKREANGETLSPEETIRLEELDVEIAASRRSFNDFCQNELPEILKEAEGNKAQQVENLRRLQDTLGALGPGTVLIHTLVTDDTLYLFLTTPGVLIIKKSEITRAELGQKVQEFYLLLNDYTADPKIVAKELYDLIIGPLASELESIDTKTIMFSLDGPLRYIPMAALYDGENWLVEKYASAIFIETARENIKDEPNWTPLVTGFGVTKEYPPFQALEEVEGELLTIVTSEGSQGGVLSGKTYLDDEFNLASLQRGLRSGSNVVHIASHFQFETPTANNRENSYLLLGNGEYLTVAEIKDMDIAALDLLTLSACNTATGIVSGDGVEVESFSNEILQIGTKAVLATLWPVNDASTRLLMENFYRARYQGDTMDKAAALRLSQMNLMHNSSDLKPVQRGAVMASFGSIKSREIKPWDGTGFSHPYYWAPFVIMGNWK